MILRNQRRPIWRGKVPQILLALIVIGGLFYPFVKDNWKTPPAGFPYCDGEVTIEEDNAIHFVGQEINFFHGETQSSDKAHSGKYSSRVNAMQEFGMALEGYSLEPGNSYEVTIWRYSETKNGFLVVDGSWGFYESIESATEFSPDGWELLRVSFMVPTGAKNPVLKAYAWNPTKTEAYFDDLTVRPIGFAQKFRYPHFSSDSIETVNLLVSDKGMEKLSRKRVEAMQKGILVSEDDDWVNIKLVQKGKEYKGEMRLKGDWTDHLRGDKWSYRVSLNPGYSWKRMITFSFQNPKTRWFLNEWIYHRFLQMEDLLAPRYDFVNLEINNVNRGIFAWEEHFEKQLIEYNKRREGPIMKFVEDGFWELMLVETNDPAGLEPLVPVVESANIEAFKLKKVLKDSTLRRQFEIASDLMTQYRNGEKPAREVFDLDKMAKYLAIVDVFRAHHGLVWHNQRLYFNPVNQKLEPIGFDAYTETGPLDWMQRPFVGHSRNPKYFSDSYWTYMLDRLFEDEDFMKLYIRYLLRYSNRDLIDRFLGGMKGDIELREALLRKEFRNYSYDWGFIRKSAHKLREVMTPRKSSAVRVNMEPAPRGQQTYRVYNFHCLPLRPLGIANEKGEILENFDTQPLIPALAAGGAPEYVSVTGTRKGKFIAYSIPGWDTVFTSPISNWAVPGGTPPEQELFNASEPESGDLYSVQDSIIRFHRKKLQSASNIVIPEGYQVEFPAGMTLDLVRGAAFISKSPVRAHGSPDAPITFTSSDKTGEGFTVLNAKEKSFLNHVIFDNLTTLTYKGWNLTGAVTFYESEVDLKKCRFQNNHCEDALNVIRSAFKMDQCDVANTYADGFDCDFCTGTVMDSHIYRTGNDGLDFSGSNIYVLRTLIEETGDKGISAGEESSLTVERVTLKNLGLGIASKDLSLVEVRSVDMENLQQGFAAYQKKPEYGGGTIVVKRYTADKVVELYAIQTGSKITIDDEEIEGTR